MKRKALPSSTFFANTKLLIVEDNGTSPQDINSMRGVLLVKKMKENAGLAEVLKLAEVTGGRTLTAQQRDHKLFRVTHLILSKNLQRKVPDILRGLRLPSPSSPTPKQEDEEENGGGGAAGAAAGAAAELPFQLVSPEWVSACLGKKQLVDTKPFLLSSTGEEEEEEKGASAASSSSSSSPSSSNKKARTTTTTPSSSIEARLAPFPDLDPETREAFIAYGGPLVLAPPYHKSFPTFACERPAPRMHPNRHLTPFFEGLEDMYLFAVGDKERATAFGRGLAVLRSWPWQIRRSKELKGVRHVGETMLKIIDEIMETGRCSRLENFQADPTNLALLDLTRVHQVGQATARKWFDAGYTSVKQIQAEIMGGEDGKEGGLKSEGGGGGGGGGEGGREMEKEVMERVMQSGFYKSQKPTQEQVFGLLYVDEYGVKMSREDVVGVEGIVREAALKALERRGLGPETLLLVTCGGYRRGKDLNGDADVLVSCTQAEGQVGLREDIKKVMVEEMGREILMLKEGNAVQGFAPHPTHEKLTSHDNMLMLIKYEGLYRRLDVISPPPDQWAFCVLGWSGTKQMEKDLRDYASERGLHLSQQAVYKDTKRLMNPKSEDGVFHTEEEVWEFLGLKYLPPRLRWA